MKKIKIAAHPNEMTLGTWNCGWSCEGAGLYKGGCLSGLNDYYKSGGHQLYFDEATKICLCTKCAEKGKSLDGINKWYGYYEQNGNKTVMDFTAFYLSQTTFFGFGND